MSSDEWGVVESIDLVGQPYDVQTELVDINELRVRTTVFSQGRVVAQRDARLHSSGHGGVEPQTARELLMLHHQNVLHGFARRTSEYLTRRGRREARSSSLHPHSALTEADMKLADGLPPAPEDPAVADALDVRRFVTDLKYRLRTASEGGQGGILEWLQVASESFEEIIEHPRFGAVRIDEQVLFHQLRERVQRALEGEHDVAELSVLREDLVAFSVYISGINQRADLIAFDQHLLAWSIAVIRKEGSTLSARTALRWLRGRDEGLDAVMSELPAADPESVISELERVLTAIT